MAHLGWDGHTAKKSCILAFGHFRHKPTATYRSSWPWGTTSTTKQQQQSVHFAIGTTQHQSNGKKSHRATAPFKTSIPSNCKRNILVPEQCPNAKMYDVLPLLCRSGAPRQRCTFCCALVSKWHQCQDERFVAVALVSKCAPTRKCRTCLAVDMVPQW